MLVSICKDMYHNRTTHYYIIPIICIAAEPSVLLTDERSNDSRVGQPNLNTRFNTLSVNTGKKSSLMYLLYYHFTIHMSRTINYDYSLVRLKPKN